MGGSVAENGSGLRVLRSCVDTLEVSFRGMVRPEVAKALRYSKARAQEEETPQPIKVDGVVLAVQSHGLKPWGYVLEHEAVQVRVSLAKNVPTVSVKLLAVGLAEYGHEGCYALAERIAVGIGADPVATVSRLDIAVDFQGWVPTMARMEGIVCPAAFRPVYPSIARPQTWQFGKGGIVVRVYNKTAELNVSGKGWQAEVWAACEGYDPADPVWRFEVQYRREVLRECGVELVADAFGKLDALLAYGLGWCSLRVPDGTAHTGDWPIAPEWEVLKAATVGAAPVDRIRVGAYLARFDALIPQIAGLLVSAGAAVSCYSAEHVSEMVLRGVEAYLADAGRDFGADVRRREWERTWGTFGNTVDAVEV